jgi:hypothetical protein
MWFMATARNLVEESRYGRSSVSLLMQLISGTLFVAATFVAAAAAAAQANALAFFDVGTPDPSQLHQVATLAYALFFVFAIKMAGVFIATTSRPRSSSAWAEGRVPEGALRRLRRAEVPRFSNDVG